MNNSSHDLVEEMLLALDANIQYLEKEGNENIKVKNGFLFTQIAEKYIYEFELDYLQEIDVELEVEVRVNSDTTNGRIVSVDENKIQIEIERYFGKVIPQARIVISSLFLLKLLKEKLQGLEGAKLNASLAEKIFGIEPIIPIIDTDLVIPNGTNPIDKYKDAALRLAMGSEISFIWGPPGTGKTELISRMIEVLFQKGLSVLLISHTNMATDEALLKTVKYLENSPEFLSGQIIRIGSIKHKDLNSEKWKLVKPEYAAGAASKPITDEIERLSFDLNKIMQEISDIQASLKDYREYNEAIENIKRINGELDSLIVQIRLAEQVLKNKDSEIVEINGRIEKYQNSNRLMQIFSGQSLSNLTRLKTESLQKSAEIKARIDDKESYVKNSYIEVKKLEQKKDQLKSKAQIDVTQLEANIGGKEDVSSKINSQINELKKELINISEYIIKNAKVIATTLTKSYSDKSVLGREYDCVIIDEASMAPLPALFHVASIVKKKIIVVGDFLQLPPVVKHKVLKDGNKTEDQYLLEEKLVAKWLKRDIFELAGITKAITKDSTIPDYVKQLRLQYRMHPEIAELINHLIYGKYGDFSLESDPNTKKNGEGGSENNPRVIDVEPIKNFRIGIYDTSALGLYPGTTDSGSYYNLFQALLAVNLAKKALENGYQSIGIISPFRAQANLIQKIIKDEKLDKVVESDTVHKFQGGEKQLIIFDVTTAKKTKLTDDDKEEGDDEKLINVAFSRAKFKCIVIADLQKIDKNHSVSSLIRKFIKYAENKNYPVINAENLIKDYYVSEETENWLKKINNIEPHKIKHGDLYTQGDFYKEFINDILKAKKEIIIHSPFITNYRTKQLLPIFSFLAAKGIKIFVITRPYWAHKGSMMNESLEMQLEMEKMEVVVLPWRGNIHDKFSVIDREILWEGSLNILSQNESLERMRRIVGEETADQMLNFYGIKKNLGNPGENQLKKCRVCKGPGNWFWTEKGMFGIWTHCLVGNHREGKPPVTLEDRENKKLKVKELRNSAKNFEYSGTPICPEDGVEMVRRKGKWGKDIWGCPKFPACRFLLPVKDTL